MNEEKTKKESTTIKDLYPHLNEEQLKEADENLKRYLEVVLRIFERVERERESISRRFDKSTKKPYD